MVEGAILIDADDAAPLLAMTRHRLIRMAKKGLIPFIDLGDKELRFSVEVLKNWAREHGKVEIK
jgi:hypothetical protein